MATERNFRGLCETQIQKQVIAVTNVENIFYGMVRLSSCSICARAPVFYPDISSYSFYYFGVKTNFTTNDESVVQQAQVLYHQSKCTTSIIANACRAVLGQLTQWHEAYVQSGLVEKI